MHMFLAFVISAIGQIASPNIVSTTNAAINTTIAVTIITRVVEIPFIII